MIEQLCIVGGKQLVGDVRVSGAKNAALPLIIAALLSSGTVKISNLPDLDDIGVLCRMMRSFGSEIKSEGTTFLEIVTPKIVNNEAPYALVKALRASFWVLGPLLARSGSAYVALPGGDAIGTRPVDIHMAGLAKLGADLQLKHGVVHATSSGRLRPAKIVLGFPSVGATHHLMMTAALIKGTTVLQNAAREPEIVAVAKLLSAMGAEVEGAGSSEIAIHGREELGDAEVSVIGDRIEACTYLAGVAAAGGRINVSGIEPSFLEGVKQVFETAGCIWSSDIPGQVISLVAPPRLGPTSIETAPFPGIATDVQPLLMAMMVLADGVSQIKETVFESRFGHVAQFRRFGAQIEVDDRLATITGVKTLSAAPVEGLDIRAAAGSLILGLCAEGVTQMSEIYHLDRGYSDLLTKFRSLGAQLSRLPTIEARELVHGC